MRSVVWLLAAFLLVLSLVPAEARADSPAVTPVRPGWAFESTTAEVAFATFTLQSNATFLIPQHKGTWDSRHRHLPAAEPGLASDILGSAAGAGLQLGVGFILESTYLWSEKTRHPAIEAMHGGLVEVESLALTNGITTLIKRLAGRCRPRGYHGKVCDEFDAFPSGHTSPIAAVGGARFVRLVETSFHDNAAGLRVASFAFSEVGMTATAILRVAAGAHSVEDVVVGAVIGQTTGILVALMHPPDAAPIDAGRVTTVNATSSAPLFVSWGGSF